MVIPLVSQDVRSQVEQLRSSVEGDEQRSAVGVAAQDILVYELPSAAAQVTAVRWDAVALYAVAPYVVAPMWHSMHWHCMQ